MAGFRRRRSVGDCTTDFATALQEARRTCHPGNVVFLDIHRAFEAVVPHSTILGTFAIAVLVGD